MVGKVTISSISIGVGSGLRKCNTGGLQDENFMNLRTCNGKSGRGTTTLLCMAIWLQHRARAVRVMQQEVSFDPGGVGNCRDLGLSVLADLLRR